MNHTCQSFRGSGFTSRNWMIKFKPEVESSRTSLASRTPSTTHFEFFGFGLGLEGQVLGLGLGLEASSPRKLPCPWLEDSTIFLTVKSLLENAVNLGENFQRLFLFGSGCCYVM